jgi:molybdopterin-containing oxidoreductase family iron-sulfur binding subunit
VRRFNFFKYAEDTSPILKALRNPDVSVRSRGVMEKCTFCVQRVNEVRITAEAENRQIRDGEVVTACQQACPASAIVFGDINNPDSAVRKAKDSARNYALLGELGTRPRTTYLAKVRNPNPSIPESVEG